MLDWLKIRIIQVVAWLLDLAKAGVTALWDILKDAFTWVFDQLMGVVVTAVGAIDMSGLAQYTAAWGDVPADIINVMGLLGVGQASAVILAAVGIRLVLQLIPFTRLGS